MSAFVSVGSLVFYIVKKTRATRRGVRSWWRTILPQQPKRNVGMLPRTLPYTTTYVSSYYCICVLILLYMCPHTAICVLILLYVSSVLPQQPQRNIAMLPLPYTTIYMSSYYCICVLILLYTYVSSYYYMCPQYYHSSQNATSPCCRCIRPFQA